MPDPSRFLSPEQLRRQPKYATRPTPGLRSRGRAVGALAEFIGRPFLPHQRYITDVATELNPPGSHLVFRYPLVVVSLPRQTGKTVLQRPVFVERCLGRPRTTAFMTAQLGKYSSARWLDLVTDLRSNSLFAQEGMVKIGRSKGSERASFPNGSSISPFAPGPDALHGETPPLVSIDEGWAFTEDQGRALRQAIDPAQQTRRDRQLWVYSAAGDASSRWWLDLQEQGRAATANPLADMAYFEWGLPDGEDPYDPDYWDWHPGLDGLITKDDLAGFAATTPHGDWLRAYMNVTLLTVGGSLIDLGTWGDHRTGTSTDLDPAHRVYGYDVAIDRSAASVWSAWRDDQGVQVRMVYTAPDATWLPGYMYDLHRQYPEAVIAADDGGPARVTTDALTLAGVPVKLLGGRDTSTAWAAFKGAANAGQVWHDGNEVLRDSIAAAVERPVGDGVALSRRRSLGAIDALVAAVAATWFADHKPALPALAW